MINGLGGYAAYGQLSVQEKLAGQRPPVDQGQGQTGTNKANREELFRALLKAAPTAETQTATAEKARSDPSPGRGQVLDLNI